MSRVISRVVSSIFGGGESASTPTPTVQPTKVMPTADQESLTKARKKSAAARRASSGRASTVFTKDEKRKTLG